MCQSERPSNSGYAEQATALLSQYESLSFEQVHHRVLAYFPTAHANILDVGSGTGRDAAHFAEQGHSVLAVEPTAPLRAGAKRLHPSTAITWLDDRLPDLYKVKALKSTFDLIMLNAVWMHLNPAQQEQGMHTLAQLTHSGSRVFFTLRHGPVPDGRVMFEVSGEHTIKLATAFGFSTLLCSTNDSIQAANRGAGVKWTTLVLER